VDWDLEEQYSHKSNGKKKKESTGLPVKTSEGRIEVATARPQSGEESDSFLGSGSENENVLETPPTDQPEDVPHVPLKGQIK
jgi:nucleolar complex protein 3